MYSSVESSPAGYLRRALAAVLYEPIFIKIGTTKSVLVCPSGHLEKSLKQLRDESPQKKRGKGPGVRSRGPRVGPHWAKGGQL